jgi:hypothetical protein
VELLLDFLSFHCDDADDDDLYCISDDGQWAESIDGNKWQQQSGNLTVRVNHHDSFIVFTVNLNSIMLRTPRDLWSKKDRSFLTVSRTVPFSG